MHIEIEVSPAILGNRVVLLAEDGEGNRIFGDKPIRKLTDIVTAFTKDEPDQDLVEDLIEALEDSLRIACAYKVKEFVSD